MTHIYQGLKHVNHPHKGHPCHLLVWHKRKALVEFADGTKLVCIGTCLRKITPAL